MTTSEEKKIIDELMKQIDAQDIYVKLEVLARLKRLVE